MKSGTMTEAQLAQAIREEKNVTQLADMLVEVGRWHLINLVPLVESHATHKDEEVRGAVLRSLLGFMSSVPHLALGITMLHKDATPEVKYEAAASLALLAAERPEHFDHICEELAVEAKTSDDRHVRQRCITELGELYGKHNTRLPDGRKWKDAKQQIVDELAARAKARSAE